MAVELEAPPVNEALCEAVPPTEWRSLFHDSPLAIAYLSPEFRILRVNAPFAVLCGRLAGEVVGRRCYEIIGEHAPEGDTRERPRRCAFCPVEQAMRAGVVQEFERPFGQATLRVVASPVEEEWGRVTGVVLMIANATAEHELRRQLTEAQRLVTVGTMTACVAHELKNPLTTVAGFAQLLSRRSDLPPDAMEQLRLMWQEARRCDHIVTNLLKFTRRRGTDRELVDVNGVIADAVELLGHTLQTACIQVRQALHPKPLRVRAHACELQQVVQNIVNNAIDALREHRGHRVLHIRTSQSCGSVIMEFENNGSHIAEPDKLFQPFYTTKEGKGTGLGLSVSHAIVREHGGRIEAANLPDGVLFRIILPVATAGAEQRLAG